MNETPTITISGTAYRVVTQLADTPTHRSFRVESEGRSYFLKVFRKEAAEGFDKQMAALAGVKADAGLLLPIETGEYNDERFVLREWVEGETFDVYTRRFKFNPKHLDEALATGEQLARAVASMHSQEVAHGRLKNENVFFGRDGDPVITDPQGTGDPRDDVRQIGLLLSRLYTRKPTLAINSRTLMELSKAKVPMNLLKVLWQAIQEEPSQRFKDAETLATALKEVPLKDHEKTVHVRAVPHAQGVQDGVDPRLKWGLVAAVLIAVVGVGGFLIGRLPDSTNGELDFAVNLSNQEPIRPRHEMTRLASGVTYYDIEIGTGPLVTSTEPVSIRIISRESEVFPLSDLDLQSMLHGLSRMRTNQYAPQNLGEPKSREGIPGMRRGGIRAIGLENRMMPEGNRDNWARNTGEPLPDEGWTTILVEVLEDEPSQSSRAVGLPGRQVLSTFQSIDQYPTELGWTWFGTNVNEREACLLQEDGLLIFSARNQRVRWTTNPDKGLFVPTAGYTVEIGLHVEHSSDECRGIGFAVAMAEGNAVGVGVVPGGYCLNGQRYDRNEVSHEGIQVVRLAVTAETAYLFVNSELLAVQPTSSVRDPFIKHNQAYFTWGQGAIAEAARGVISYVAFDDSGAFAP